MADVKTVVKFFGDFYRFAVQVCQLKQNDGDENISADHAFRIDCLSEQKFAFESKPDFSKVRPMAEELNKLSNDMKFSELEEDEKIRRCLETLKTYAKVFVTIADRSEFEKERETLTEIAKAYEIGLLNGEPDENFLKNLEENLANIEAQLIKKGTDLVVPSP
ncbi:hypothetical protein AVEN_102246-1 [Araneus ventricosus]|uniref:Uncharacterized protein n=1 Tax=Araneus ventricosus TaxID=182803 RepID=A0A4Y2WLK9_ARAVE|nr:hypothetical protein AVEN_102246-1 [Araneus ventricosus]